MSFLLSDVIADVRDVLLDNGTAYYFWSDVSLIRWAQDALEAAANLKRDIMPQVIAVPLVAGTVQQIPAGALQFMEPYFNVGSGAAVVPGELRSISRRFPNWRATGPGAQFPAGRDIEMTAPDERSPIIFHCFPPADGTGTIMALCGMSPLLTGVGCLPLSNALLPIPDNYRQAIVDGICSKALGAQTRRQDVTKANFYWQRFEAGILGGKMAQRETLMVPTTEGTREGQ